jgi:hypothetical protein
MLLLGWATGEMIKNENAADGQFDVDFSTENLAEELIRQPIRSEVEYSDDPRGRAREHRSGLSRHCHQ